jgi:hypothetical protein
MLSTFFSTFFPRFDDLAQKLLWKIAAILATGTGLAGNDIVTGPATGSGDWWVIHACGGDCVFNSVTFKPGTSTGSLAGKTLSNGDRLYGNIIGYDLASGTLVLYRTSAGSP